MIRLTARRTGAILIAVAFLIAMVTAGMVCQLSRLASL